MPTEKKLKEAVVVFLKKNNEILLAKKTRYIGKGCWNGYGGGLEENETAADCALRELTEESGGVIGNRENLEKIAETVIENEVSDGSHFILTVHYYVLSSWVGEAQETEEMSSPTWFPLHQLPLNEMMPGDKIWLPDALLGRKLHIKMSYTPFQKEMQDDPSIQEVMSFST